MALFLCLYLHLTYCCEAFQIMSKSTEMKTGWLQTSCRNITGIFGLHMYHTTTYMCRVLWLKDCACEHNDRVWGLHSQHCQLFLLSCMFDIYNRNYLRLCLAAGRLSRKRLISVSEDQQVRWHWQWQAWSPQDLQTQENTRKHERSQWGADKMHQIQNKCNRPLVFLFITDYQTGI